MSRNTAGFVAFFNLIAGLANIAIAVEWNLPTNFGLGVVNVLVFCVCLWELVRR